MFVDPDPIEQDMGVRVEKMNPDQLVAYLKTYHAAYGLDLAVEGHQERAIFRSLQKIYGQADAGRIVKWVTYTHKGRWDGSPVRFASFCKARKWWVDIMHLEMQDGLRVDAAITARRAPGVRKVSF